MRQLLLTIPASLSLWLLTLLFSPALFSSQLSQLQAKELIFYTYHDKPPYYFSKKNTQLSPNRPHLGLYQAFIDLLNQQQDQWQIRLQYIPRKRMDLHLQAKTLDGAVIGVNPLWFRDKQQTRYLWSQPILWDVDVIAVKAEEGFPYHHPDDLINKLLALPRGYYFWGVSENIAGGQQKVIKATSELQNLKLVASRRVDATILSAKTLRFYESTVFPPNTFHTLNNPHDRYFRAILFPSKVSAAYESLEPLIKALSISPEWQEATRKQSQEEAEQSSVSSRQDKLAPIT